MAAAFVGFDFRPPSSGRSDPNNKFESAEYKLMVEGVRKTLDNIDKVVGILHMRRLANMPC